MSVSNTTARDISHTKQDGKTSSKTLLKSTSVFTQKDTVSSMSEVRSRTGTMQLMFFLKNSSIVSHPIDNIYDNNKFDSIYSAYIKYQFMLYTVNIIFYIL